jgi:hypothetical protein
MTLMQRQLFTGNITSVSSLSYRLDDTIDYNGSLIMISKFSSKVVQYGSYWRGDYTQHTSSL